MAQTLTTKLKLAKHDTGDLNWGADANANVDALDVHAQQATLRPPRTLSATLGSGAVGANLLGNTTYFYKVTAINAVGETTEGQIPAVVEAQVTQPATPLPVILQWETVSGATGYKVYKFTASGQEQFLAQVAGQATSTYTDTGNTATTATTVPAANTARTSVTQIVAGSNVTVSPPDGTGAVTVNAAAQTPTGAAGGDLSGTYPNPAVTKVNGTSVPASPSAGQVLVATSPTAAAWQTPAASYAATVVAAAPTGVAATDTAAINAAISALPAGGGRVLLREGTYAITPQIVIPAAKPIWIMGQGKATILQPAAFGNGIFKGPASGNIDGLTFSDFHIDGSVSAGVGVIDLQPAAGQTFDKIKVQRVTLVNGGRIMNLGGSATAVLTNLAVLDCVSIDPQANGGLFFCFSGAASSVNKVIIANNHVTQQATIGIPLLQIMGTHFAIENNYLEQPGGSINDGIISISGNLSKSSIVGNVFVGATAVANTPGFTPTISDCVFSSNVADTLAAFNNSFFFSSTLTNNTFAGNKCSFPINMGSSSSNNVVVGNRATISGGSASDNLVGNDGNTFNAVAVSNAAPTTGQVLTATSPTAAAWQTPAGGGGYATVVVAAPTGVAATDTANIQNAINSIGSGTVILREGLYLVNAKITLKSRITIKGQGKGEFGSGAPTTIKCDNAMGDTPLFDVDNLQNLKDVAFEDFSIDFNGFSRAARSGSYDIRMMATRARFLRIAVANTSGTGPAIYIQPADTTEQDSPTVDNCVFVQGKVCAGGVGDFAAAFTIGGKVTNCTFIGETANGGFQSALASFLSASAVVGCVFRTNQDYTTGVQGATVGLSTAASNGRSGMLVADCVFIQEANTATRAIQVVNDGSGSVTITGNYSSTGTNVGSVSVRNAGGSGSVMIVGNAGFSSYGEFGGGSMVANDAQTFNGVAVSSTAPSTGQVLTATSPTAAAWQTPAGGGGYATAVVAAPTGVAATDTANINAALTAVAANGGTVILREGTYLVNATLSPASNVTICGQGRGATVIKADAGLGSNSLFNIASGSTQVTIQDLKLNFNFSVRGTIASINDMTIVGAGFKMLRVWAIGHTAGTGASAFSMVNNTSVAGNMVIDNCKFDVFGDNGSQGPTCGNGYIAANSLLVSGSMFRTFSGDIVLITANTSGSTNLGFISVIGNEFYSIINNITDLVKVVTGIVANNRFSSSVTVTRSISTAGFSASQVVASGNCALNGSANNGAITIGGTNTSATGNVGFSSYTASVTAANS